MQYNPNKTRFLPLLESAYGNSLKVWLFPWNFLNSGRSAVTVPGTSPKQ
ncbi:uncharacterized protein METZ01_LOCUS513068 [marine metagenome]|uniref:Uncharacterized protein n=1 Tax=marine metagenome TaxID=408172 RepID=A0A383EUF1_9ZZZZ